MSIIRHPFFSLPIHGHTEGRYNRESADKTKGVVQERDNERKKIGAPMLNGKEREDLEQRHALSPWYHNDVVGFVELGMDGGDHMSADIILRRKLFPRNTWWPGTTLDNQRFEYFCEVYPKVRVDFELGNESFVQALDELLQQAEEEICALNKGFVLYRPPFGFCCFDFARANQAMKTNAPGAAP